MVLTCTLIRRATRCFRRDTITLRHHVTRDRVLRALLRRSTAQTLTTAEVIVRAYSRMAAELPCDVSAATAVAHVVAPCGDLRSLQLSADDDTLRPFSEACLLCIARLDPEGFLK